MGYQYGAFIILQSPPIVLSNPCALSFRVQSGAGLAFESVFMRACESGYDLRPRLVDCLLPDSLGRPHLCIAVLFATLCSVDALVPVTANLTDEHLRMPHLEFGYRDFSLLVTIRCEPRPIRVGATCVQIYDVEPATILYIENGLIFPYGLLLRFFIHMTQDMADRCQEYALHLPFSLPRDLIADSDQISR